jgi:cysteinyl-tRNA synthetase
MSEKHLGTEFEIHGGGLDLVFPHHENEIAQSRSLGHAFAKIFMHNGMLQFQGEEMHKSLGNDVSLREALDEWGREALLVFFLTGHWRKPLEFSAEAMARAATQWRKLSNVVVDHERHVDPRSPTWDDFASALNDDFNTPKALAVIHAWHAAGEASLLTQGLEVFGLPRPSQHHRVTLTARVTVSDSVSLAAAGESALPDSLIDMAERRAAARAHGDFELADQIRAEISSRGWTLEDTSAGYRVVPQSALVQHLGNEPPEDVRRLAETRYGARQEWDDAQVAQIDEELGNRGFLVDDLIDGYVIVSRSRRK